MDTLSREKRSWNMSRIRGRDTIPEKAVRSALHAQGFRFRLAKSPLPGSPDVVLSRHRIAVFVHGCFWHRHRRCRFAYTPKSNKDFWNDKFQKNVARDRRTNRLLRGLGWTPVIIWECQTTQPAKLAHAVDKILQLSS